MEKVLTESNINFYDIVNRPFITISEVKLREFETNLVVVYTKDNDSTKVITVYPCKNLEKELKRRTEMDKNIKMWFDVEEDTLYLSLKEGVAIDSEEISDNIRIEYDELGNPVGIEIYNISKILANSIAEHLQNLTKKVKSNV